MSFKDKIKNKSKKELQDLKAKKLVHKNEKIRHKAYHDKVLAELDDTLDSKVLSSRNSTHSFWKEKLGKSIEEIDSHILDIEAEITEKH